MSGKAPPDALVRLYEEALENFPDEDHRAALKLALDARRRQQQGRRGRPQVYGREELLRIARLISDESIPSVWRAAQMLAAELKGGGGTLDSKARALMRRIGEVDAGGDLALINLAYMKTKKYKERRKAREKDKKLGYPRDIDRLARLPRDRARQELLKRGYSETACLSVLDHLEADYGWINRRLDRHLEFVRRAAWKELQIQKMLDDPPALQWQLGADERLAREAATVVGLERQPQRLERHLQLASGFGHGRSLPNRLP